MAVIYTIAHPLTNDIVYVGCSKMLRYRIKSHINSKNKTQVNLWIQELKNNYLLPKIEAVDFVDYEDSMYMEKYWIEQLTAWGFNLLNVNKISKSKNSIIYGTALVGKRKRLGAIVKERKSRFWSIDDFKIGTIHIIEKSKRSVFVVSYNQMRKKLNQPKTYLDIKDNGDNFIATVMPGIKPKSSLRNHITKNGNLIYYTPKEKGKKNKDQKGHAM